MCPLECFQEKRWFPERMQFSGSFFEIFRTFDVFLWTFDELFAAGLSKQQSKCPEKNFERKLFGKFFLDNFRFFEIFAAGCSELHPACPGE